MAIKQNTENSRQNLFISNLPRFQECGGEVADWNEPSTPVRVDEPVAEAIAKNSIYFSIEAIGVTFVRNVVPLFLGVKMMIRV
jgi:hypothetical protein